MSSREPAVLLAPCPAALLSLLLLGASACGGDGGGGLTFPPSTGSIQVNTTTAGDEPDTDGYTLQLDGEPPESIGTVATFERNELQPGGHTLRLDGLAANCSVADNPRSMAVVAGDTVSSTFEVTCTATSGGLLITTVTSGASPDPDGYAVVLDGVEQGPIGVNGQVPLTGLALGSHVVGLSGLAGNCVLEGENLRAVTVTPAGSTPVDYAIACSAPPPNAGTLHIVTVTTGDMPEPAGYSFVLDGGPNQPIGANDVADVINLPPGAHQVQLAGLVDNCRVQGGTSRAVNVTAGGSTDVRFAVNCTRPVGAIRVTVSTSGSPPDPNGYRVRLDEAAPGEPVDDDGSVRFNEVAVGSHTVTLDDVAANCAIDGGPSHPVAVTTDDVAEVRFRVSCGATSGSVVVTTQTTGSSVDPDGYNVLVDGRNQGTVASSGQTTITGLAVGSHTIELSGVASNCQVQGDNQRTITVADGGSTPLAYAVSCETPPPGTGSLTIITITDGPEPDNDGYAFAVDGKPAEAIGVNDTTTLADLRPGGHTVQLSGIAQNCGLQQGTNPRVVTVPEGGTVTVRFRLSCSATTGTIAVHVETTGSQPDPDGYVLAMDNSATKNVDATGDVEFESVSAGDHTVTLRDVASNCTVAGGTSQQVTVSENQTKDVTFSVDCPGAEPETGSIHVTSSIGGGGGDPDGYDLSVNNAVKHVDPNGEATFDALQPGPYTVVLSGLAENCSVQDESQDVSVEAGQTTEVAFAITCSSQSVNRSPAAANDSYRIPPGPGFSVPGGNAAPRLTDNDTDPDGDPLSTNPESKQTREQGSVLIGAEGSFDYTTPSETFTGEDTFEYTVIDGRGGESTAVVTITVGVEE